MEKVSEVSGQIFELIKNIFLFLLRIYIEVLTPLDDEKKLIIVITTGVILTVLILIIAYKFF